MRSDAECNEELIEGDTYLIYYMHSFAPAVVALPCLRNLTSQAYLL